MRPQHNGSPLLKKCLTTNIANLYYFMKVRENGATVLGAGKDDFAHPRVAQFSFTARHHEVLLVFLETSAGKGICPVPVVLHVTNCRMRML